MSKLVNCFELDYLEEREREALRCERLAFQKYAEARDRTNVAYDIMQSAWDKRCSTRKEMNRLFETMQSHGKYYREIWDRYTKIRDTNNARIKLLRREADFEHQMMKDCFSRASVVYRDGNKTEAIELSASGHEHKRRRDELSAEIGGLVQEIRDAKTNAERTAFKTDNSVFRNAKEAFDSAKACHESAERDFKVAKSERDRYKAEYDSARRKHIRLKEDLRVKLIEARIKK